MKPIMLVILDGFGMREEIHGNAIKQAHTPNFDYLWNTYPHSLLQASGEEVGLPADQMGNSEVGHLNIGAGRIVQQPLQIINKSIEEDRLKDNTKLLEVISHVKKHDSKLHIMGLGSDGGVHSHINHLLGLIEVATAKGIKKLYLHLFLDGRDTLPTCASKFIKQVETKLQTSKVGKIATLSGRYYAMDRDNNWPRTNLAYDVLVNGANPTKDKPLEVIAKSYEQNITDEFIIPTTITKEGLIEDNDGLIFANFRTDRAVQLLKAITEENFTKFPIKKLTNLKLVLMMPSAKLPQLPALFEPVKLENKLGEYLAKMGYTQLRIAETEKYAHVTYFFDGLEDISIEGCHKILIPSPKVKTYDLKPEMSIYEVTAQVLQELEHKHYDFTLLNFANPDMVGHTGNLTATIQAIEAVDICLGKIYQAITSLNGLLLVTADHGNAEYMLDSNHNIVTAHTTNLVPFIICNSNFKVKDGKLADIAPTILTLFKIDPPSQMTGHIIIEKR